MSPIAGGAHPNSWLNHVISRRSQPKGQIPGKYNLQVPGKGPQFNYKTAGGKRLGLRANQQLPIDLMPVGRMPVAVQNNPGLITPGYPGGNVGSKKPLTGVAPPRSPLLTSKPGWQPAQPMLRYRPVGIRILRGTGYVGGRVGATRNIKRRRF